MFKLNTKLVRQEILRRGLSTIEFAQQAGLNHLTARKIIEGREAVQLKTLSRLAAFLGIDDASKLIVDKE